MVKVIDRQQKKLVSEVNVLKRHMRLLQSFAASMVNEDKEGVYRPEFIKEVLRASQETPQHEFINAKDFLKQLHKQ